MPIATLHETDGLSATAFDLQSISDNMKGTLYVSSCPGFSKTDGANEERKAAHLAFSLTRAFTLSSASRQKMNAQPLALLICRNASELQA